ncbi:mitochondrial substrate carrier family protein [Striga asiatica]|uniref:Mitochondrial substrate carrier family protein n=1 Tax=Striga asiatica TaxID=4170 RepID=A0A5A7PZD2_STRAF|nr:mitochondrial substrate carrier family protein [Striga asiatica]
MASSLDQTSAFHPKTHDGLEFWQFMVAGSIAGSIEHMAMFPVDTLKTRVQAISPSPKTPLLNLRQSLSSIMKLQGLSGLYRGITAMGLGAGPAHAIYFSVYESSKKFLSSFGSPNNNNVVAHAASGVFATVSSDAFYTPMDVVKQRLQLEGSPYRGVCDCVRRVFTEEGINGFYASYRTTVFMNAPFTAVHFATYEAAKRGLSSSSSEESLFVHATAGAAAGGLAAAVTTPLDVVKTQLQCQVRCKMDPKKKKLCFRNGYPSRSGLLSVRKGHFLMGVQGNDQVEGVCGCDRFSSSSIMDMIRTIKKKDGYGGLMRGWIPRMLFHAPAAAICWSTYEGVKSFFQART